MKTFFFNIWRIGRWILLVILILFIGLVIYRIPFVAEQEKTQETIEYINAQKLVIEDVSGERLPPLPDPKLVDATVEGVDVNKNNIRDDVELAIFEMYPGNENIKIRSAMLQHVMALQLYLTEVFNSETWIVVTQEEERALGCLLEVYVSDGSEEDDGLDDYFTSRTEVIELVFNINKRQEVSDTLNKYQSSFVLLRGENCDIVVSD